MICLQQRVLNDLKSSGHSQPRCSAEALCCCQSARSVLRNHKCTPQHSCCWSTCGCKGSVAVSARLAGHQSDCSAGSEHSSDVRIVVPELDLLKAHLDPEVRNVLPNGVPLDLRFEEARPAEEMLKVQLFGTQPSLAGLWQTAETEAQIKVGHLNTILALSAGSRAESIRCATLYSFVIKSVANIHMQECMSYCVHALRYADMLVTVVAQGFKRNLPPNPTLSLL